MSQGTGPAVNLMQIAHQRFSGKKAVGKMCDRTTGELFVSLSQDELQDLIHTLTIRVLDERRMWVDAADERTRRACAEAAERLTQLSRKLAQVIGAS